MKKKRNGVGAEIKRLRATYKKRNDATGQLYNLAADLNRKNKAIVLWGLFVSDENTFLLRPHLFTRKEAMIGTQWDSWFRKHYGKILRDNILPHMSNRTADKQWRLYRIIGWTAGDNTKIKSPATRKKRNKTKRKR